MTTSVEPVRRGAMAHAALSAGIAFSWTAMSDSASAQQRPMPLEPIDVSGQAADGASLQPGLALPPNSFNTLTASSAKQTAPLLDTPQTVTIIPQAITREQGARTLTEVLRNTPGISFDAGENGFGTSTNNFKLRGFDSSANIFVDGSRDSGSYTRDMFNVERVEVFKGAASDNGRGGPGGYVNMVTKTPLMQNFLAGEVSYGWD
jgi:catecholate siderophore receptor